MIETKPFAYPPAEHEEEKASNSYVMSLVAVMAGLPLPVVNLVATLIFFMGNRKGSYFVRWHCTQALLSQLSLFIMNSIGVGWTIYNLAGPGEFNDLYFGYAITTVLYNLAEFIATIYTAVKVRKGIHVSWCFYGTLTDVMCRPQLKNSFNNSSFNR